MDEIIQTLEDKRAQARLGGGQRRIDSQHAKGKLTARAVNLPFACCESMRRCPPPRRAWARLSSSVWIISSILRLLPQPFNEIDITALICTQQFLPRKTHIALQKSQEAFSLHKFIQKP